MEQAYERDRILYLSLGEITRIHGEDGLKRRLFYEVERIGWSDQDRRRILELADRVTDVYHYGDRRDDKTYATHVLRVAARLIGRDHFNYQDNPQLVIAALLHDVIEDHPERILGEEALDDHDMSPANITARQQQRERALVHIAGTYGVEVANMVEDLSNEIYDETGLNQDEKHQIYQHHVSELMQSGRPAAIIKLSDFVDNCLGLQFNPDINRRYKLARKYAPLLPVMLQYALDSDLKSSVKTNITDELLYALYLCQQIIATEGQSSDVPDATPLWPTNSHTEETWNGSASGPAGYTTTQSRNF
jgi:hypothetical protein